MNDENMINPKFYFTVHPGDMIRARLIEGSSVMMVAAAYWNNEQKRFKIARPAADHLGSFVIDSGGFTAARRWGRYPWSVEQYVDFIREMGRDLRLDFCAVMDYACESGVDRSTYRTNRERIKATIRNEMSCVAAAPDLPWLPVLQGDSLDERGFDIALRRRIGLLPDRYAGIGSMCGRGAVAARNVIKFYMSVLPGVQYHGFGMHVQALDDDTCFSVVRSWDSYSWTWGRGQKDVDRPAECYHRPGETWTIYTRRLAQFYWDNTILPRLTTYRQGVLL